MIGDKEEQFQGKGTDLGGLQSHIEEYLKSDGFTVQSSTPGEQGVVIQAKKGGFLPRGRCCGPSADRHDCG